MKLKNLTRHNVGCHHSGRSESGTHFLQNDKVVAQFSQ